MKIQLVLGYKELFGEPCPLYAELLEGTPTKAIVAYYSAINNALELREDSFETQAFIFRAISQNFPPEVTEFLARKLAYYQKMDRPFSLFTPRYIVGFLYRLLRNYRDFEQKVVPPEEELNAFKAYLCYVDEINEADNEKLTVILDQQNVADSDQFGHIIWPYMIKQFEFSYPLDILYEGLKGIAFVTFLQRSEEYRPYLQNFLAKTNTTDPVQYVGGLIELIKANINGANRDRFNGFIQLFLFNPNEPVLSELVFDPEKVRNNDPEKSDYLDLKERPIVHYNADRHVVPYWGYVYQAMFQGLVFAFYRKSGVQNIKKNFDNFTSSIGLEFTEKWLFRKLMQTCFHHKHTCVEFPLTEEFNPDCYYRKGKYIFLFEFKDSLLNKDVIHSFSYEEIKSAIDTKLAQKASNGGKNKGVFQLSRLFKKLGIEPAGTLQFDQEGQRLKPRNIVIFPILVHTNKYFDLPGVNQYLTNLLMQETSELNLPFSIKPLTVINLQYFFQYQQLFRDEKIDLREKIDMFHHEVARRSKKANRTGDPDNKMDMYPSFHEVQLNSSQEYKFYKRESMVKSAFECWDLPRETE